MIAKSVRSSCCGRGGSWFRNCGSAGNSNLEHKWVEGIQACKSRSPSKAAIGQQVNGAQQLHSSNGADTTNFKAIITAAENKYIFVSAAESNNTSNTTSDRTYTEDDPGTATVSTLSSMSVPTPTITAVNAQITSSADTPTGNTSMSITEISTLVTKTTILTLTQTVKYAIITTDWISQGMCYPHDVCKPMHISV